MDNTLVDSTLFSDIVDDIKKYIEFYYNLI